MTSNQKLLIGPRYVFFNSLAEKKQSIYVQAYNTGTGLVNQTAAQLVPTQTNPDGLEKIRSYVETIGQMAENERMNEINFIQQCKSLLSKDKTGELINNISTFLDDFQKGKFDYYKLINLINEVLSRRDELEKERQRIVADNLKILTENLDFQENSMQESYHQAFESNYQAFATQARKQLLEPIYDDARNEYIEYQTNINSLFSTKINSALRYLSKSKTLEEKVREAWTNNWNSETIASELIAIVTKYVTSIQPSKLRNMQGQAIARQIENSLESLRENLTPQYIENIVNLMQQRTTRSIEEVVLTSRRGVADMFIALEAAERKAMVKNYNMDIDSKILERMEKDKIFSEIKKMPYNKFLQTPYWKIISENQKRCAGKRCALCGYPYILNVHHTTYKHHGDEIFHLDDLVTVCRECHRAIHGIDSINTEQKRSELKQWIDKNGIHHPTSIYERYKSTSYEQIKNLNFNDMKPV